MQAFETVAILDDASHLTLREPLPSTSVRECRVIVLFDVPGRVPGAWPTGFLDEIHITDPEFARAPQGEMPPAPNLEA